MLEVALSVQELPRPGLAAYHLTIGFHPSTAHTLYAALEHPFPNPSEQLWVVLLKPRIRLGRTPIEGEVRVFTHQLEHGAKGSHDFAPGFMDRPEPTEVNVGVSTHREVALGRIAHSQALEFDF